MTVSSELDRRTYQQHWCIQGRVQGVGFRPFLYRLATRFNLKGLAHNNGKGVSLVVQGTKQQLNRFSEQFHLTLPNAAEINKIEIKEDRVKTYFSDFSIAASQADNIATEIAPDLSLCSACLKEMLTPTDRRYLYPFINCTDCGPRYSIVTSLPYDRETTSMAHFRQCDDCLTEYNTPSDRRFHAEPNACPQCGPTLSFHHATGTEINTDTPIAMAAQQIVSGAIVAVKGIGGYQLICDARNTQAVKRLRQRKHRPHKPFAVMAPNLASVAQWVSLSNTDQELLQSSAAPIVILPKKDPAKRLAGIAPDIDHLGVMLPYAPIHYLLLLAASSNTQTASTWPTDPQQTLWIVTSANRSEAPLVNDNTKAITELSSIADYFLMHDREIVTRSDDSVWQGGSQPTIIRRARGYAPASLNLGFTACPTLACGTDSKNTICLARGQHAYLSQYIGDLQHSECSDVFNDTIHHLLRTLSIKPERVVCDLHEDFFSSRFAEQFATDYDIPCVRVQHHHAHIGAVLAEHRCDPMAANRYLGVALDGFGHGTDDAAWGGELFLLEERHINRIGHFKPLPLPGGDRAAQEPWRMAIAALSQLPGDVHDEDWASPHVDSSIIRKMIKSRVNSPYSSSAGRWFDAVAGILGCCDKMTFEAQAAMQLESLARQWHKTAVGGWQNGYVISDGILDLTPALPMLLENHSRAEAAWRWHQTFIEGITAWVNDATQRTGVNKVVLSGGCLQNQIVRSGIINIFKNSKIDLMLSIEVPANDGGISLGQVWVSHFLYPQTCMSGNDHSGEFCFPVALVSSSYGFR